MGSFHERIVTNMGIQNMQLELAEKVKVEFAPGDKLTPLVHCLCCATSIYMDYPACCGLQQEQQCCCFSKSVGLKCLQFLDENKAIQKSRSALMCIDCTQEKSVCHEAAEDMICCFCITGAQKTWMGIEDMDPCFIRGNQLCCDQRLACPPAKETVPMGIACCGVQLYGDSMADSGGGAPPAEAKNAATAEKPPSA